MYIYYSAKGYKRAVGIEVAQKEKFSKQDNFTIRNLSNDNSIKSKLWFHITKNTWQMKT